MTLQTSPNDAAWCAGYLDGEGCFSATCARGDRWRPTLRAVSTDRRALERLQAFLGGTIHSRARRPSRVRAWTWYLNSHLLEPALRALIRHLTTKRADAQILLAMLFADEVASLRLAHALRARKTKPGNRRGGPQALSSATAHDVELAAHGADS